MKQPFDIVWFDAPHSEQAIKTLALLPGGEDERKARGKSHHFTMCPNAPMPNVEGKFTGAKCYCVYTDRLGAETLLAGNVCDSRVCIVDLCSSVVEVEEGFLGGWIKPEYWESPEVVKSAAGRSKNEAATAEKLNQVKTVKQAERAIALRNAEKGYWRTAARFVGSNHPKGTSVSELKQIVMMGVLMGKKVVSFREWMKVVSRQFEPDEEEKEYDPVSFLAHAQNGYMAAKAAGH
jgi:hypothetical protein